MSSLFHSPLGKLLESEHPVKIPCLPVVWVCGQFGSRSPRPGSQTHAGRQSSPTDSAEEGMRSQAKSCDRTSPGSVGGWPAALGLLGKAREFSEIPPAPTPRLSNLNSRVVICGQCHSVPRAATSRSRWTKRASGGVERKAKSPTQQNLWLGLWRWQDSSS